MRHTTLAAFAAVTLSAAFASAALAAPKVYVATTNGDDNNPCTTAAPCRFFQKAHDTVDAGGDVYALDVLADYGPITITKAINIYSPTQDPGNRASISVATGAAITVNAGPNDVVTLLNLQLDGQGTAENGVLFNSGRELQIFGGVMRRFQAGAPNGFGIKFVPSNSGAKLLVQDSTFNGNGNAASNTGGGIQVTPTSNGGAQILLTRVRSQLNSFGFAIDTSSAASGGVNAVIDGGAYHFNRADGIIIVGSANAGIALLVKDALSFANTGYGIRAFGASTTARVYSSSFVGNGFGAATANSGAILSYGNNVVDANSSNNGLPATTPQK